jgi:hypothetical protein
MGSASPGRTISCPSQLTRLVLYGPFARCPPGLTGAKLSSGPDVSEKRVNNTPQLGRARLLEVEMIAPRTPLAGISCAGVGLEGGRAPSGTSAPTSPTPERPYRRLQSSEAPWPAPSTLPTLTETPPSPGRRCLCLLDAAPRSDRHLAGSSCFLRESHPLKPRICCPPPARERQPGLPARYMCGTWAAEPPMLETPPPQARTRDEK